MRGWADRRVNHAVDLALHTRLCAGDLALGNPADDLSFRQLGVGREAAALCDGVLLRQADVGGVNAIGSSHVVLYGDDYIGLPIDLGQGVHGDYGGGESGHG